MNTQLNRKQNRAPKKYTTIIFDFDGTLGNSMELILKIFNSLSEKYNFKKISLSQATMFRNRKPSEILKLLAIPYYKVPFLLMEGRENKFQDHIL